MSLGHASGTETGKARGGVPGDQTKQEVVIRDWYDRGWTHVLRPVNTLIAERTVQACEAGCANDNIGYDQGSRNTAHDEAKKVSYNLSKIKTPCNTDCSAFMTLCAIAGGVTELEYTGNAPTTSTMVAAFTKTGKYTALTDNRYLTMDAYLRRGDILVAPGKHTAMVLTNGSNVAPVTTALSYPCKGIDVSIYQNPAKMNYQAIKNSGVQFVVIKALGKNNQVDRFFEQHYANCSALNLPIYVYQYSYARDIEQAASEAKAMVATLANKNIEGIFLDVEDGALQGLGVKLIHNINTYVSIIQSAGYKCAIYSGKSFIQDRIMPYIDQLVCRQFWIARYPNTTKLDINIDPDSQYLPKFNGIDTIGWQYSSNVRCDGYSDKLDANIFYKNIEKNKRKAGAGAQFTVKVNANTLRIRTAPVDGEVIEYTALNDKLFVYEVDPRTGWYKVGNNMWIGNNFVQKI